MEEKPDYIEEYQMESNEGYLFKFRHDNTFIVLYDHPDYIRHNHILYMAEDRGPLLLFDCQPAMDALIEEGWDYIPVDCEPAAHVLGGLAIVDDIDEIQNLKPQDFS